MTQVLVLEGISCSGIGRLLDVEGPRSRDLSTPCFIADEAESVPVYTN